MKDLYITANQAELDEMIELGLSGWLKQFTVLICPTIQAIEKELG